MKKLLYIVLLSTMSLLSNAQTAWQPNPKYIKKDTTEMKQRYQCNGTTSKGARCRRLVSTPDGYCYQHLYQKPEPKSH